MARINKDFRMMILPADQDVGPMLPPSDQEATYDIGPEVKTDDAGATSTEQDDGSVTIDFAPSINKGAKMEAPHDANLAPLLEQEFGETYLNTIAGELDQGITADKQSSKPHFDFLSEGMEMLGFKIEKRVQPFVGACGANHPMLAEAIIRAQAAARNEMLPPAGPARASIIGEANEAIEMQAIRVKDFTNFYLTEMASEFYPEYDQMLFYFFFQGSTFKKVYSCPIRKRPVSPLILPQDLIVSYYAPDLRSAQRVTNVIKTLHSDLRKLQVGEDPFYRDIPISAPSSETDSKTKLEKAVDKIDGRTVQLTDGDYWHNLYESCCLWNLKGFEDEDGIARPYVITIDQETKKLLAIRRNWLENDPRKLPRDWYVHYKMLPGPGFYGLGYLHLLGNSTKAATTILRLLVDTGTLNSWPGGLKAKGLSIPYQSGGSGPMEFREIDTGGMPIQNVVSFYPYKEPSQALFQMFQDIVASGRQLGSTAELPVGDGRQDAPVGTTVALMEAANKIHSGVIKRLHESMRSELRLITNEIKLWLPPNAPYPYRVAGGQNIIAKQDFDDRVDVLPVSDPNITSTTQRTILAEAILRMAQQNPGALNVQEAMRRVLIQLNVPDIDKLIIKPQEAIPLDPISENMGAMSGAPLKVGPYQNHAAHVQAHFSFASSPAVQSNPQALQSLVAHMQEHIAADYRVKLENAIGQRLPPPGQPLPPELEDQIAMIAAHYGDEISKQLAAMPGQAGLDPVAWQKLQLDAQKLSQKAQEAFMRHTENMTRLKAETANKAADRQARLNTAELKSITDIVTKIIEGKTQRSVASQHRANGGSDG